MQRLIRSACAVAAEDIGKERADNCAARAQIRCEALCRENAWDSKALWAHTFKRIYPAIAVYMAVTENGIGQEKAAWYIREYFRLLAASYAAPLQGAIRIFGSAEHIPRLFMKISVRCGMS